MSILYGADTKYEVVISYGKYHHFLKNSRSYYIIDKVYSYHRNFRRIKLEDRELKLFVESILNKHYPKK